MLDVDLLKAEVGSIVELSDVLLVGGNGSVKVGTPLVDGARVIAEVVEHGRDKKITVFKYKNKTRYRRKRGHRQDYTRLAIRGILAAGEDAPADEEEKPKRAARKRAAPKAKAEMAAASESAAAQAADATIEASADEAPAKRKPARRAAKATTPEKATAIDAVADAKPVRRTSRAKAKDAEDSGE